MNSLLNTFAHRAVAAAALLVASAASAVNIEPPKAQIVDRYGVNMANGQVTHSTPTVSIGGAMGLSHSVSVIANEFNYPSNRGFQDKYYAQARNVELSTSIDMAPRNVLRVYDDSGSADFAYYVGGTLYNDGWTLTSGYSYVPIGDERQILEYDANYLYWTKADGTVVRFARTGSPQSAASSALLVDITYPNGFAITVASGGMSVKTNTGWQLKALYESDTRPMEKTNNPNLINVTTATTSAASGWSGINPKYIVGINNTREHCNPSSTAVNAVDCNLTANKWPTATFNWPAGMPRTMYIGTTSMNVVNAAGGVTTYNFKAYDLAYVKQQGGAIAQGYTTGREYSPRLVGVAPPGSGVQFTYDYNNVFVTQSDGWYGTWDSRLQSAGVVSYATRQSYGTYYDMRGSYYDDIVNTGSGGVSRVQIHARVPGALASIYTADTDEGSILYEASARNWISRIDSYTKGRLDYEYTRGNLTKVTNGLGALANAPTARAEYPTSCTTSTRKTCNQPTRTYDAKGNATDYEYHPQSGQLAKITLPADIHNVRPQTRYEYTQKVAHYFTGGGSRVDGSPIWLKTAERSCINSVAGANGGCPSGDEVVTRYEYDSNNLLLTGMTVTAPDGTVLRTCYRHDDYGNVIGTTQPNAGLTICPSEYVP